MPGVPAASIISGLAARLRSLWRGLRRRSDIETEMTDEFRHHVELRTEDLIRRGLEPAEARRQARIEFGHIEGLKEDARESRGLRFFDRIRFSWLDVKLGLRMLVKYPGLSVVSVVGMSLAIAIAAAAFAVLHTATDPSLPLDEGDRLVSIENWDVRSNTASLRSLHDFREWQAELKSVRELGAFHWESRNVLVANHPPQLVHVAEMTASGFTIARVSPALGRPLLEEDEREDAPPVVVIAYEEWQRLFGGDVEILGRPIRLGSTLHTVVGVMPEGFRFPLQHRYWVPLRANPARYQRGSGPSIHVFGRLADGATREQAQTELTTIGTRLAAAYPETHEHLRPRVVPYTHPFLGMNTPSVGLLLRSIQFVISMMLILIAVNVAVLVYARTATRTGEIAVRAALGASRRRIVLQLFVEALVLSLLAAAVGLAIAGIGLATVQNILERAMRGALAHGQVDDAPFWLHFGLSMKLVVYVAGLTMVAAAIVGVLPALRATGRRVQAGLQQLSSRGAQMQLGRTWTALIVAQVAVAVAVLPLAFHLAGQSLRRAAAEPGYAAEYLLNATLGMERDEPPPNMDAAAHERVLDARFRDRAAELVRRLEAEPAVSGVTFTSYLTGYPYARIEGEGGATSWVFIKRVDVDLFTVFDIPLLSGRGFVASDTRANSVIINRVLAERLFGGGNVLGRHIRYVGEDEDAPGQKGRWLEIVGVAPDYGIQLDLEPPHARLYQPIAVASIATPVTLTLRIRGTASQTFAQRLREVTTSVDPTLQLPRLSSAAAVERQASRILGFIALATLAVTMSVVLLSAAGIYAMMSFTVAKRRREIGIRSALGADPRRLLVAIFKRASIQLGVGVLAGLGLAAAMREPFEDNPTPLLTLAAVLMVVVGLLAALGPARRGLAVQPTEALREE